MSIEIEQFGTYVQVLVMYTASAGGSGTLSGVCSAMVSWLDSAPPATYTDDQGYEHPIYGKLGIVHGSVEVGGATARGGEYGPLVVYPGTVVGGNTGLVVGGSKTSGCVVIGAGVSGCSSIGVNATGYGWLQDAVLTSCPSCLTIGDSNPVVVGSLVSSPSIYGIQFSNASFPNEVKEFRLHTKNSVGTQFRLSPVYLLMYAPEVSGYYVCELCTGVMGDAKLVAAHALSGTRVKGSTISVGKAALRMEANSVLLLPLDDLIEDKHEIAGTLVSLGSNSVVDSPLSGTYTMIGRGPLFDIQNAGASLSLSDLYVDCKNVGRVVRDGTHADSIDSTVELSNVKIFNAGPHVSGESELGGGAIYSHGGTIVIEKCEFDGVEHTDSGQAFSGGFIYAWGGQLTVTNSVFRNATINAGVATNNYMGGAVFLDRSSLYNTIEHCLFEDNYAHNGGAVACKSGALVIRNTAFVDNTAKIEGGSTWAGGGHIFAIASDANGILILEHCIFANGSIGVNGGGSDSHGGAVKITGASSKTQLADIKRCTFDRNKATYGGSALATAQTGGGTAQATIQDSILSRNYPGSALRAYLGLGSINVAYTDFWENTSGDVTAPITKGAGCFTANPLYCGSGSLAIG